MTLPVVFRPEAAADVLDARNHYERQRQTLGDRFADAVDEAIALIAKNPELFAAVLHDVRRSKLRRFPYIVYYRILANRIEVIAVLHGSRHPQTWQRRAQ